MPVNLKSKKQLVSRIVGVGANRVRFDKSTNVYTFTYLNSDRGTSTTTKLTVDPK